MDSMSNPGGFQCKRQIHKGARESISHNQRGDRLLRKSI